MALPEAVKNYIREVGSLFAFILRKGLLKEFADFKEAAIILNSSSNCKVFILYNDQFEYNAEQIKEIFSIFKDNPRIITILISNCYINDNIESLISMINNNPMLESFTIYNYTDEHSISANNIELISNALESSSHLTTLKINDGTMSNNMLINIINSQKQNSSLNELTIKNVKLEKSGIKAICDLLSESQVTYLSLISNGINDVNSIVDLAESFKKLKLIQLILNGIEICDAGAEAISSAIKEIYCLRYLEMENNKITEKGITTLCQITALNKNLDTYRLREKLTASLKLKIELQTKVASLNYYDITKTTNVELPSQEEVITDMIGESVDNGANLV